MGAREAIFESDLLPPFATPRSGRGRVVLTREEGDASRHRYAVFNPWLAFDFQPELSDAVVFDIFKKLRRKVVSPLSDTFTSTSAAWWKSVYFQLLKCMAWLLLPLACFGDNAGPRMLIGNSQSEQNATWSTTR